MPDKRTFPSKGSGNDVRNGRLGGACGARRRANRAGPMVHKCPDKRFRPRSRAKNDIDHLVVCVFVANDSGVRHCVEYGPVVGTEESRSSGESMAFSNEMCLPFVKDLSGANPAPGHARFPPRGIRTLSPKRNKERGVRMDWLDLRYQGRDLASPADTGGCCQSGSPSNTNGAQNAGSSGKTNVPTGSVTFTSPARRLRIKASCADRNAAALSDPLSHWR